MITTFLYNVGADLVQMITNIVNFSTQGFHQQLIGFSDGLAFFLNGVWYFNGMFPVGSALTLILFILSFETMMLFIGIFEWVWHKLPFVSSQ